MLTCSKEISDTENATTQCKPQRKTTFYVSTSFLSRILNEKNNPDAKIAQLSENESSIKCALKYSP